jgi:hypothetical protein
LLSCSPLALATGLASAAPLPAEIVQYSVPEGIAHNDDFAVKVRAPGLRLFRPAHAGILLRRLMRIWPRARSRAKLFL